MFAARYLTGRHERLQLLHQLLDDFLHQFGGPAVVDWINKQDSVLLDNLAESTATIGKP